MKKLTFIAILAALVVWPTDMNAQGWLRKLKDKAVEKVKEKVENKVEKEVGDATDDVLDGKISKKSNRNSGGDDEVAGEADPKAATSSDFKRGSVILFQDDMKGETVGEFPSKWDMFSGTVETKTLGGVKAINPTDNAQNTAAHQGAGCLSAGGVHHRI